MAGIRLEISPHNFEHLIHSHADTELSYHHNPKNHLTGFDSIDWFIFNAKPKRVLYYHCHSLFEEFCIQHSLSSIYRFFFLLLVFGCMILVLKSYVRFYVCYAKIECVGAYLIIMTIIKFSINISVFGKLMFRK